MSFQKKVNLYNEAATQGDRASQNPTVYIPINFLAGEAVNVGGFVWRDSDKPDVLVKANGEGAPLGFVEREINNSNYVIGQDGTLVIEKGERVTVAQRGDFFVTADADVSIGAAVYANTSTGVATFESAGAIDTGYKAMTAADNGAMVIISNW